MNIDLQKELAVDALTAILLLKVISKIASYFLNIAVNPLHYLFL